MRATAFVLAWALATLSVGALASEQTSSAAIDDHGHHAHEHSALPVPGAGELWPTDEALRTAMTRIERALSAASSADQALTLESARALAVTVEQNVAYMVEHCKLPPEPDAALHVLIARMLGPANVLKNEPRPAALAELAGALHDYRSAFDHSPAAPSTRQ